ncbi:unnamed protein product [Toxocara canis]|uniref:Lysosome-associated membrane glycoprotein 1 n=1 Tax=Toxocara canis TaxID=6265 RepID=A0A3P7IUF3_TOXCA|nr:unnamed protein product [Toxocara canis]
MVQNVRLERYFPIQNADTGEFGLAERNGATCLLLKFSANLYNLNLNGTNIVTQVPKISSPEVKLSGYCALHDSKKNSAQLLIKWKTEGRKKSLKLYFDTANVKTLIKQLEELRWQLENVTYTETYNGLSVEFNSSDVVISAPLKQKFVCRDKLNISLHNDRFKDYILELEPDIYAQPYNAAEGSANIYVCERTRRRTLAESFQNKMTILSGVILGISSVSMLAGYSVRRQLHPSRQQLYQTLS